MLKLRNIFLHLKTAVSNFGCVKKNSDEVDPILLKLKSQRLKKMKLYIIDAQSFMNSLNSVCLTIYFCKLFAL